MSGPLVVVHRDATVLAQAVAARIITAGSTQLIVDWLQGTVETDEETIIAAFLEEVVSLDLFLVLHGDP